MELVLYTADNSRGFLVEWLLEELEAPYRRELLDLSAGEQKREAYLAIHPLGAVPALVVDGRPMMESLEHRKFKALSPSIPTSPTDRATSPLRHRA